ncbi:MAG: hypothetical protein E7F68_03725 [Clostridium butyricum]|nr:hypothetical protein [Clostridium butyricum]
MSYRIINGQAYSVGNFEHISNNQNNLNVKSTKEDKSFRDVLKDAIEKERAKDNIFTNVDSVVIL